MVTTPEFDIAVRPDGRGRVVVAVDGEMDLFTVPQFERSVAHGLARTETMLVIDLTRATFMESSSLGVLIGAHRRLARHGRSLVIACDQEVILKVLRITGLDGVFEVVPSVRDAETPRRAQ